MTHLAANQLTRRHPTDSSRPPLLNAVSFELRGGQRIAIQGSSGSGKTLLLRATVGLDPLDSGEVIWSDQFVTPANVRALRSSVVYVAQRCSLTPGSVLENLELPRTFAIRLQTGASSLPTIDWGGELKRLGRAADLLSRQVGLLSGGEVQLINLLRAIGVRPHVLLLDEATSAMDAETTGQVETWLHEWLQADARRAWIWVSHDARQAVRVSDSIWTMENGCLRK